jgi:hypothetical protein
MARKSKKKLFEALDQFFGTDAYSKNGLNAKGISDETYGRDSQIYIDCQGRRKELESFLRVNDFMVNSSYGKGGDYTEVGVSYFKGYHWNV